MRQTFFGDLRIIVIQTICTNLADLIIRRKSRTRLTTARHTAARACHDFDEIPANFARSYFIKDLSRCARTVADRHTDIAGAKALGMATLYMHTNLTPPDQVEADPALHPDCAPGTEFEYEGYDWGELVGIIKNM